MGALLATLGFEWNPPRYPSEDHMSSSLSMETDVSDETLVQEMMALARKDAYRDMVYRCDLYKGLDQRVSENALHVVWRINVDHPLVYVLIAEKGQQPIHLVNDVYGDMVVYDDADVEEALDYLISLCSKAGHEIMNNPTSELNKGSIFTFSIPKKIKKAFAPR